MTEQRNETEMEMYDITMDLVDDGWIWVDVRPLFYLDMRHDHDESVTVPQLTTNYVEIMTLNVEFTNNDRGFFIDL